MQSLKNFLNTLFAPDSMTCYTPHPHGIEVWPYPSDRDVFFSINSMHTSRADANVTCLRNFLIEIDSMPLDDQISYVTGKVPVTSIVFSGSKSYHFIISLETPLATKAEYDSVARRLLKLLPAADKSCKNPSRLSRLPLAVRPETNLVQRLVLLNERIPNDQLLLLLPQDTVTMTPKRSPDEVRLLTTPLILEAADAPNQVMAKMGMDSRNRFFFWLHNRFKDAGMGVDAQWYYTEKAYNNLSDKEDFGWDEAQAAARLK